MKATELRIGNFIDCEGLSTVRDINQYRLRVDYVLNDDKRNSSVPIDLFEPTPLTEEWGIKFGTPESSMNFSFILHNDIKLWVDKSNENDFQWWFVWKGNYIRVRYVHQLQNLYHALTGNELTISE